MFTSHVRYFWFHWRVGYRTITRLNQVHPALEYQLSSTEKAARTSLDETKIIETLKLITPSGLVQDVQYSNFRKPKPIKLYPLPPPKSLEKHSINEYARDLAESNYQYSLQAENYIDQTLQDLISTGVLNLQTYNCILEHYVRKVIYHRSKLIKKRMDDDDNVEPDIQTYNLLLQLYLKYDKTKTESVMSLFEKMKKHNIEPNLSSLYFVYSNLKQMNHLLLEHMTVMKVPLENINTVIVKHMAQSGVPPKLILRFLEDHKIHRGIPVNNAMIEAYLQLEPESVFDYIHQISENEGFQGNTKTAKLFVSHYCTKGEPYFGLSYGKYLAEKFRLTNAEEIYVTMLSHHLNVALAAEQWIALARYYYYKARKLVPAKLKSQIIARSLTLNSNANFSEEFTKDEMQTFRNIDTIFKWKGAPIPKLSDNTPEYQKLVEEYFIKSC
ncbi:hypothetical protein KL935_000803 [Ogataea polymorpha]|uniref:Mitochondrial 15S rRNA processing factor CCM1 n=1 Tax=Ogataea polymorpha TaxID=460523 RepID=A0A9P8PCX3_9ASCO|nr:hypothetical protein KL935_000803 [Ogataea polymorpha]KAG7938220.1 hypothetical protein KL934_000794 [Ogataea polymorpha]KAH3669943.1 hypothetical protein OGATHE_002756 [Ogataea polymorpha]